MKVRNINGTSSNTCKCASWLKHWGKFSGGTAGLCKEKTCMSTATVGAHVQKSDSTDQNWYIIPLCDSHNKMVGKEIELYGTPTLVSANVSETCGTK